LVDDELIYAFYESQIPADICNGAGFERWYQDQSRSRPKLLWLTRDELMRHEAAGITTDLFPRTLRLGGVDCRATYLHDPGDSRDGLTVELPLFALNQASEERAEWLVPGMLKDKVLALLKSLPQRPRSRLVPLPEAAARFAQGLEFGQGSLTDALLRAVRDSTGLSVPRTDFKLDMLSPHLFMNFRVLDDQGRQLGMSRNLAALKAELSASARGAFQALAALRTVPATATPVAAEKGAPPPVQSSERAAVSAPEQGSERYTAWTFGELPELMEIGRRGQSVIGFPALVDQQDAVSIEVFEDLAEAAQRHRVGLRRLFALQHKEALKYLEKNIPDLQRMAVAYMPLGSVDQLRAQIIDVALDRAFMMEPLPKDESEFKVRLTEGRPRLTLIANEVTRLASVILAQYALAVRKIKDTRNQAEAVSDANQQLQRLMPRQFLVATPYAQLQHFERYLKALVLRLDKLKTDATRDAQKLAELRPQEQRYWRLVSDRKGKVDARMEEFRWLIEELRVSFFAQELRTPQPVSIKRLDKIWTQLIG